jgi:anti-sigma factor RsiW
MAETPHGTDEDLQRYLDGSLTEGRDRLEAHVRECRECRWQLEAYERVFAFARYEMERGEAESGLDRALSARVFRPPKAASAAEGFLLGGAIGLSLALLAVCLTLVFRARPTADLFAAVMGIAGALALLAVKETGLMKRFMYSMLQGGRSE